MKRIFTLLYLVLIAGISTASIIHVPGDYPTIQAGINAANSGDTVQVAPGTYYENVQMAEGITLLGSGMENTIIDGGALGDVISAIQVNNVVIEGFTVQNSQQGGSSPGNIGIFLNPQSSAGTKTVRNCHIRNCGKGIDIWNDFGGVAYIEHNIISDNIYDGFDPYLGTTYLTNNTIVDNGRDGYHDWSGGGAVYIQNNIIANNGRYGVYKHLTTPVYISYNDVWNNAEGAYYQGYSGPAEPFEPDPGTGEIAADPLFAASPFDYYISWANFPIPDSTMSPCIDAGNPASPLDPDMTVADMGALYFDQRIQDITIALTPYGTPIQIPALGGSFNYNIAATNNEPTTQNFDVWIMVMLPNGTQYGPVLGPVNLDLSGGNSINRDRTQNVPAGAPSGDYTYTAYAGIYPTTIWSSDYFTFTKLATGDDNFGVKDWQNTGTSFSASALETAEIPAELVLLRAYPNPFNPMTTIRFCLPEAANVKLVVYNPAGQTQGLPLLNGWREAGLQEVTFDASAWASGVYFYRISAGKNEASGKMVLLK